MQNLTPCARIGRLTERHIDHTLCGIDTAGRDGIPDVLKDMEECGKLGGTWLEA